MVEPGLLVRAKLITERDLQDAIVACAQMFGWRIFHPWISVGSASGYPDLTMVRDGRLIVAELKSQRGQVSPAQAAWLAELREVRGIEVYEWRPEDWLSDAVIEVLR